MNIDLKNLFFILGIIIGIIISVSIIGILGTIIIMTIGMTIKYIYF